MKKLVERVVKVEQFYCNICEKPVTGDPFKTERINIVRGLFKVSDFHGHDTCINKVVREAFSKYLPVKIK